MVVASDSAAVHLFAGIGIVGYALFGFAILVPAVSMNGWLVIPGQGTLTRVQRVEIEDVGETRHASVLAADGSLFEKRIIGRMCVFRSG